MKFEFTGETKVEFGITFKRIRALKEFSCVAAGDIGGWIEKEGNLSVSGNAWVSGDARVSGNAQASGNAWVSGDADIIYLGAPDGWQACSFCIAGQMRVQVGCRDLTIAEGRKYWSDKNNRREVLAALDYAEAIGKLRGWIKTENA